MILIIFNQNNFFENLNKKLNYFNLIIVKNIFYLKLVFLGKIMTFYKTKEKLNQIQDCYENIIFLERQLIDEYNNKLTKENELNNLTELNREMYNNERRNLENRIDIKQKRNESNINIF